MRVVIFTGGELQKGKFVDQALKKADRIIAADSGADIAVGWGMRLDAVVGDMDSISPTIRQQLEGKEVVFVSSASEKDETDTQLAIQYAIEEGATEILILGGVSTDRIDHTLANISLTYHQKVSIKLINGDQRSWVISGPATVEIQGQQNGLLSLIPLSKEVTHIKTEGLYYPLLNEPLYFGTSRGISNVFAEDHASVKFEEGLLLFIHTTLV